MRRWVYVYCISSKWCGGPWLMYLYSNIAGSNCSSISSHISEPVWFSYRVASAHFRSLIQRVCFSASYISESKAIVPLQRSTHTSRSLYRTVFCALDDCGQLLEDRLNLRPHVTPGLKDSEDTYPKRETLCVYMCVG